MQYSGKTVNGKCTPDSLAKLVRWRFVSIAIQTGLSSWSDTFNTSDILCTKNHPLQLRSRVIFLLNILMIFSNFRTQHTGPALILRSDQCEYFKVESHFYTEVLCISQTATLGVFFHRLQSLLISQSREPWVIVISLPFLIHCQLSCDVNVVEWVVKIWLEQHINQR